MGEDTERATSFAAANPDHRHESIVMPAGSPQPIDLSAHAVQGPIRVTPFKVNHTPDVPSAMGMMIELLTDDGKVALRLGYTGDTAYFQDLPKHPASCDVLLAHISQPNFSRQCSLQK